MNLGETIFRLRTEKHLSQGDLADMLDVSRQSVSKWETNQSVPDLDKIVKLSKIFEVTLDEFVLGEKQVAEAAVEQKVPVEVRVIKETHTPGRKVAGIILFCMAFLVMLMVGLMGQLAEGIILAIPFLTCGIICMVFKQNAGLWCAWAIYVIYDVYTVVAIGIGSWKNALVTLLYDRVITAGSFMALVQLACMIILIGVTIFRFRKQPVNTSGKILCLLACGWILFLILNIPVDWFVDIWYVWFGLIIKIVDLCLLVLFAVLMVFTVRFIRSKKEENFK